MAYTLTLDDQDAGHIDEIRKECEALTMRDVNFNGARIIVETGDFTACSGPNEINGMRLLQLVRDVVES
jgi:hypothetical protein